MGINYRNITDPMEALRLLPFLQGLDRFYPDIIFWYVNRVIPNMTLGNDPVLIAEDHDQIVGLGIGRVGDRPKLRCIRVAPSYQNRGVGLHLIDRLLKRLDCDRPVTTVAPELIHDWSRVLVNRYEFTLDHVSKGRFRPRQLEYEFNTRGEV